MLPLLLTLFFWATILLGWLAMKKFSKILTCVLVGACAVGVAGCKDKTDPSFVGAPKTNEIVYGNDGLAVRKGGYLYFVNGFDGYSNMTSKNQEHKVGALLVAKLDVNGDLVVDDNDMIKDAYYSFISKKLCGFEPTNLCILGDYLYFVSPSTRDVADGDSVGEWAKNRSCFYRVKLDLSAKVEELYEARVEHEKLSFAYYLNGNKPYILIHEAGTSLDDDDKQDVLVRVDVNAKKSVTVAENVSSFVLKNASKDNALEDVFFVVNDEGYKLYRYNVAENEKVQYETNDEEIVVKAVGDTFVYITVGSNKLLKRANFSNGNKAFTSLARVDYFDSMTFAPDGTCAFGARGGLIEKYEFMSTTSSLVVEDEDASSVTFLGFYNNSVVYIDSNKNVKTVSYKTNNPQIKTITTLTDVTLDNTVDGKTYVKYDIDDNFMYFYKEYNGQQALYRLDLSKENNPQLVGVYEVADKEN